MKQALKDLILSEHPEDNALAVAILKQKTWRIFRGIIPIIIKRFMIFNIGDTKEFLRINDAYWEPYTTKNGGGGKLEDLNTISMTDKEFNNIKDLILSECEEDNLLAVNMLRAIGEDVKEVIFNSLSVNNTAEMRVLTKYFKITVWGNIRNIQDFKLHEKYE